MGLGWSECEGRLRTWVLDTCAQIERELGANHVGTYLHGSLAASSFHPPKSDIDILFVVEHALDAKSRLHVSVAAALANQRRPITGSLECSILRRSALSDGQHPLPFEVHFGEEWAEDILAGRFDFEAERTDTDLAAHVQAVCEVGIVLTGAAIEEIFQPLPRSVFVHSLLGDLEWILAKENILESPFYGVLNVARILWVLEEASPRLVPSKEEAGEWLLEIAPNAHHDVIRMALDVYRDSAEVPLAARRTGGRAWPSEELLEFRDWARERTEPWARSASSDRR